MVFCAAYGCSSRSFPRGGFSNITERRRFFCFPKTEQQKKRWITAVKRQALTVTKYTKLCDLHFLPSDFTERGYLKPNAVPLSPYVTKEHTARKIASEKRYHERTKRKEGSSLNISDAERQDNTKRVVDLMVKSGLPWCTYRLEQVLDPSFCSSSPQADQSPMSDLEAQMTGLQVDERLKDKLVGLLAAAKTLTAKENLIHTLRTQLLVAVARHRGFSKLLLGDSSTRLAVRMLSDITQGRGAHVALQMSFADCRHDDVTIVRPMREFVAKEVAMLLGLNGVESTVIPTLATMTSGPSSLDRLTEEFVAGLQSAHPRTVPTVFRTGEKMDIKLEDSANLPRCVLCKAPIDTDVGESSALSATLFSQSLSNSKKRCSPKAETEESCCGEGDGSCKSQRTSLSLGELQHALCYGCRLVVKDVGDIAALPEGVLEAAGRATRRNQMKDDIQEYLLEDDQ